jgi:hypothetical protein
MTFTTHDLADVLGHLERRVRALQHTFELMAADADSPQQSDMYDGHADLASGICDSIADLNRRLPQAVRDLRLYEAPEDATR